jgi:negative regulator of sigma E activity
MKKIIFALSILGISMLMSCAKITEQQATEVCTKMLTALQQKNYASMNDLYSAEFNEIETVDKRKEKHEALFAATGDIQSFKLASAKETTIDERTVFAVNYDVQCANTLTHHDFIVASEEGATKIISHLIKN